MNVRLHRLTTLRAPDSEPEYQQQAQRLLWVNLCWIVLAFLALPAALIWIASGDSLESALVLFSLSGIPAVIIHQSIQGQKLDWARVLFVFNVLAVSLLAVFPAYRLDTPVIVLFSLPLTTAGLLLKRNGLITTALVMMVLLLVAGVLQISAEQDATPLGDSRSESIGRTIGLGLVVIALNAAVVGIFGASRLRTSSQSRFLTDLVTTTLALSDTLTRLPVDPINTLDRMVEQLRDAFKLYHVQIFTTDPVSGLTTLQASTGYLGRRLLEERSLLRPDESSAVHQALRQSDPLLIESSAPEEQRSNFLPATRSELLIPLRVGKLVAFGVLDLHSTEYDAFSPSTLNTLMSLCNQLAVALYAARQVEELKSSYDERDRVLEQMDLLQRELLRANQQIVGTTWGSFLEEHPGRVPGFDWYDRTIRPAQNEGTFLNTTMADGQAHLELHDDFHVLSVPIRLRGQTLGALEFRRSSAVGWSPQALELAQAVADRLALSLENARLFEQTQLIAQREHQVSEITARLQASNDLERLVNLAVAEFHDALGATHTQVRLGLLPGSESPLGNGTRE